MSEEIHLLSKLPKLFKRKPDSHKGDFGHVLIIGGDYGMGGAIIMAAEAAYRTGAGKVSVLSRKENYTALLARLPNAMTIYDGKIFDNKNVIAIGCGLGKSSWAKDLLKKTLASKLPKIIDADALNLISENKKILKLQNAIITPHVGEAARLLGLDTTQIQRNRKMAVKKLQKKFGCIAILKGKNTLICGDDFLHECQFGNPGMATAGMGDALCGIIAALVAQGLDLKNAAIYGVEIHASAGDLIAKKQGEVGMMPQDLIGAIPLVIRS
ncbi:MAG: NAD(P)H-hydrate dehydratase [Alphaproteobacteria bacterium RIFCSPLOWO2_01_FULL_40_26]|nr:MAG: NAD(P)H-hydrate dehydratase [Alphaproteobacteria bacterium RIFCSPHIGHO2_02_FULL_40_34]OFW88892.1 MAG: NAD(P)H-hydrate dehydratase [Alphaproteobacteria bacterium RIFCSPHIGHO2_01_FULL_40_8]OFW94553.1 MAG: NAD(P)H-hydrate dehydratase [Alphaproteobacteria bacterium RIFCSPLOWO2_01_FULL_40_26]OFX10302.1 MAG: NAD(P)H-hydrate dehydratase [Alphaproteobacteria bacterium RIFCSPLOWO2_02_FULL_40_19]OFX11903.1 MAG: NAD(P)H-hydrate dehydratase [Alphaproteobacteria bacterium RIFCSPLOWO2_12_FULL_40_11]